MLPEALADALREAAPVCVAFSGGVDSSTVVAAAAAVLGPAAVLAVTASSPICLEDELGVARDFAGRLGVCHVVIDVDVQIDIGRVFAPWTLRAASR